MVNNIGCCFLDWCVDCCVFGKIGMWVFGVDFRCVDFLIKQCLDMVVFFGKGDGVIYIGLNIGEVFKIVVDEFLCFGLWDVQILCQVKVGNFVDDVKVDCFGLMVDVRGYLIKWYVEYFVGGYGVNVMIVVECLFECVDFCYVGKDVQFDLIIVEVDDYFVFGGNECFVNVVFFFGVDWDVLQVWIG